MGKDIIISIMGLNLNTEDICSVCESCEDRMNVTSTIIASYECD